jgi:hypothetical protein
MPRVSEFFGTTISMYFNDHAPAHFHARYAEHEALVTIEGMEIIRGELPRRALALVLEWAALHRAALRGNWEQARRGEALQAIPPLE